LFNYAQAILDLHTLLQREYWKSDRLKDFQNERLRSVIKYAYDFVPFYHKKFRLLGLKPSDFKSKEDLRKLPVLSKSEIRQNVKEMVSTEFDLNDLRMLSTSGSTGSPLFLYINGRENMFRKAKHLRANFACGQKPLDKWVTIIAPHHFGEASKFQRSLGLFTPTPISVFTETSAQVSLIERLQPDILDGYSSSLFVLAKELEKNDVSTIRPKSVIGGAELIDSNSREFIEKIFQTSFYDQYSSVEMERMSWQCCVRDQYHIDSDALIMEFVDKNGEEVSSGERGEIVCTSLFNYAMPFFRYAIGDVGIPSDEMCSCGRSLPLMKTVEGRKDSLLVLPDGRSLTPRAFTIAMNMFKYYSFIEQFRVVQNKIDLFEFSLVLKKESIGKDVVEAEFVKHLKKVFCHDQMRFDIKFVDSIPLDKNGKFKVAVSNLKQRR